MTHEDLRGEHDRIVEELRRAGVSPTAAVALECSNRLADVRVLLALFDCGFHVVLLPPPATGAGSCGKSGWLPAYCSHVVRGPGPAEDAAGHPGAVRVRHNPGWNGRSLDGLPPTVHLLTSGSTGEPRLAVHFHESLKRHARLCAGRFALDTADRVAIPVPVHHSYGFTTALLPALAAGAAVDLQEGANALTLLERERAFDPTVAFLTPGLCRTVNRIRRSPRPHRLTLCAGDLLDEGTAREFERLHGPVAAVYGCTELGAIATGAPQDPPEVRATTVGRPLPGVRVELLPAEGATSGTGEIAVRHPCAFAGYADEDGRPQAARATDAYRTHDLGRFREDGALVVLGRLDGRVKRDGRLLALAEVESALRALDGVGRAAVVPGPRGPRGVTLAAFCVPDTAGVPSPAELRRAASAVLPAYAVPDRFVVVDDLPLLPSGKIDRVSLAARGDAACPAGGAS